MSIEKMFCFVVFLVEYKITSKRTVSIIKLRLQRYQFRKLSDKYLLGAFHLLTKVTALELEIEIFFLFSPIQTIQTQLKYQLTENTRDCGLTKASR